MHVTIFMTVVVWGDSFLDLFLEFVLPSYLAPGGIPELPRRGYQSVFWLYTKLEFVKTIRAHPQYKRLSELVNVEIVCIDEQTDISGHQTVYETMNACHLDFISRSERAKAAMVFFSPDAFWSNGSLHYTLDQVESGKRAILIAGVRAQKEAVLAELMPLRTRILEKGLTGRELVSLLINYPHRITQSLTWNSEQVDIGWASHLYWPVKKNGYLGRCFHLHTFFVHPRFEARPEVAHDFDWLDRIGLKTNEISIVRDSDQICALELSPQARGINGRIGRRTIPALADWARRYAAADHRLYVRKAIYFHVGSRTSWAWLRTRFFSGIVLRLILLMARVQSWLRMELRSDDRWLCTFPLIINFRNFLERVRNHANRFLSR
jgi:hypothetical protein